MSSSSVEQCAPCADSTHDVHHAIVEVNVVIGVLVVHCELRVVPVVVCDDAVVRRTLVLIAFIVAFVFVVAIFSQDFAVLEEQCLHDLEGSLASTEVAHLHCIVIVRCNEASQSDRNTFPAVLFQAQDNVLNRTVTIIVLVRQQLERFDQVVTKSLRDRVRPEKCRFIFVCAELHYQNPVGSSPFKPFSTDCTPPTAVLLRRRYPPNIVLQMKTVAIRADIRQNEPLHSTDRRNDSPQKISVFFKISCTQTSP